MCLRNNRSDRGSYYWLRIIPFIKAHACSKLRSNSKTGKGYISNIKRVNKLFFHEICILVFLMQNICRNHTKKISSDRKQEGKIWISTKHRPHIRPADSKVFPDQYTVLCITHQIIMLETLYWNDEKRRLNRKRIPYNRVSHLRQGKVRVRWVNFIII